jgi:hypothetical protein
MGQQIKMAIIEMYSTGGAYTLWLGKSEKRYPRWLFVLQEFDSNLFS